MNESNYYTTHIAYMYYIRRMQQTYGISSGSFAGLGSHYICYKAKDKSGNESKQCCFYVYVNRKEVLQFVILSIYGTFSNL